MRSRRFPSSLAIVSLLTGLGALLTACDSGPSGPTHFSILSPGESRVTVLPGESVHFQVQLNSTGFRVEYAVDGETVHEGPTFDFTPVLVEHTVRVSVLPVASTAAPDVQEFTVGVAVPGNTPPAVSSWDFFDRLLTEAHVVGAPGGGFGPSGEGYFRLTAFGSRAQTLEALERVRSRLV